MRHRTLVACIGGALALALASVSASALPASSGPALENGAPGAAATSLAGWRRWHRRNFYSGGYGYRNPYSYYRPRHYYRSYGYRSYGRDDYCPPRYRGYRDRYDYDY